MLSHFNSQIATLRSNLVTPSSNNNITTNLNYQFIKDFVNSSLYEINKSIIEGEYVIVDIESDITTIKNYIDLLEIDYPNYLKIKKYLDVIRNGLNKYFNYFEKIRNIYGLKIIDNIITSRSIKSLFHSELRLLDLNIKLSLIDNNFNSNNYTINQLLYLKSDLDLLSINGNFGNIHIALKTKLNFLSYKWYLRTAQKENNIQYSHILRRLENNFPRNLFDDWNEKTLNHYEISGHKWEDYFKIEFEHIKNLNNPSLTFFQLSNKVKYLKDVSKNEIDFENLLNDIETHFSSQTTHTELEKISNNLLVNYIINNYFSLFCEKRHIDFTILKKKNDKNILAKTKIILEKILEKYYVLNSKLRGNTNNFFLDFKVSDYCTKILNDVYDTCTDKKQFIEVFHDEINNIIYDIIENYKRKKEWSLLNNNYIFKLDYQSSLKNHNNLNVYYASSYTLAKVDDDIENKFKLVEEAYKDLKLRDTMKHEIEAIHSLSIEFKKDNKRLIEMVTLFTAIISFIVGSIGAFSFISNFKQALIFLLCYAIAISLFVLLMYIANYSMNSYKLNTGNNKVRLFQNNIVAYHLDYPKYTLRSIKFAIFLIIIYTSSFGLLYYLMNFNDSIPKKDPPKKEVYKDNTLHKQGVQINSKTNDN